MLRTGLVSELGGRRCLVHLEVQPHLSAVRLGCRDRHAVGLRPVAQLAPDGCAYAGREVLGAVTESGDRPTIWVGRSDTAGPPRLRSSSRSRPPLGPDSGPSGQAPPGRTTAVQPRTTPNTRPCPARSPPRKHQHTHHAPSPAPACCPRRPSWLGYRELPARARTGWAKRDQRAPGRRDRMIMRNARMNSGLRCSPEDRRTGVLVSVLVGGAREAR